MHKNIKKIFLTFFMSVLIYGCDYKPDIRQEDKDFIEKIKMELSDKPVIKASQIHSGNWDEVCSYYAGANGNLKLRLAKKFKIDSTEVKLLNDSPFYITETVGLLYFIYPDRSVKSYQIYWPQMMLYVGDGECMDREEAQLKAVENINKYKDLKWREKIGMPNDYIGIAITKK